MMVTMVPAALLGFCPLLVPLGCPFLGPFCLPFWLHFWVIFLFIFRSRFGLTFWRPLGPYFGPKAAQESAQRSPVQPKRCQNHWFLRGVLHVAFFCFLWASWCRLGGLLAPTGPLRADFWTPKCSQIEPKKFSKNGSLKGLSGPSANQGPLAKGKAENEG